MFYVDYAVGFEDFIERVNTQKKTNTTVDWLKKDRCLHAARCLLFSRCARSRPAGLTLTPANCLLLRTLHEANVSPECRRSLCKCLIRPWPMRRGDGYLVPVAIEVIREKGGPSTVYTRCDVSELWGLAKFMFLSLDSGKNPLAWSS